MAYWYCDSKNCDWSGDVACSGDLCPKCQCSRISPQVRRCPVNGVTLHPKAAGLNSRHTHVVQGDNVASAEPCPRLSAESDAPATTSSQRFLNRFSAGGSLKAATPFPRAMKNRLSTSLQHPPALLPSPKVAGASNDLSLRDAQRHADFVSRMRGMKW